MFDFWCTFGAKLCVLGPCVWTLPQRIEQPGAVRFWPLCHIATAWSEPNSITWNKICDNCIWFVSFGLQLIYLCKFVCVCARRSTYLLHQRWTRQFHDIHFIIQGVDLYRRGQVRSMLFAGKAQPGAHSCRETGEDHLQTRHGLDVLVKTGGRTTGFLTDQHKKESIEKRRRGGGED